MQFKKSYQKLFKEKSLTKEQYEYLHKIENHDLVSIFYELRTLLYLGVLLFSTGVGILIYKYVGEIGHIIAIFGITIVCGLCFWYILSKKIAYSHDKARFPTPYYDYVLLLGSLLLISLQGYIQYQYEWFSGGLAINSLVSGIIFFALAYRFDHIGILSLGIVALGSFMGINLSPSNWQEIDNYNASAYYNIGILFGTGLCIAGLATYYQNIKKHFLFTYMNFGILLFLFCATTGIFESNNLGWAYIIVQVIALAGVVKYALWKKSFLFLLYAFIFGYITLTYLVFQIKVENLFFHFFYFLGSCGGFIAFIIHFRKYFKDS